MRARCTFSTRACRRATSSLAALSAAGLSTCGPWAGATDEATTPAVNANVDGCGPGVDGADDAGELDGTCDRVMGDGAGAKAAGVHAGQHDGGHAGVEGGGGGGGTSSVRSGMGVRGPATKNKKLHLPLPSTPVTSGSEMAALRSSPAKAAATKYT